MYLLSLKFKLTTLTISNIMYLIETLLFISTQSLNTMSCLQRDDADSEDDKMSRDLSRVVPQGTDKVPGILDNVLQGLSDK